MGLIKAAIGAIGSTMQDQWKEAIRCENMPNDVLMVKKTTPNGVISNKSTIIVAPGQCAIIYDNGRVIDATAEEGAYTFDSSSTPSFFAGQFGAVFKEMWQRFTYNGATAKQQAVFFFNTKEIVDNRFGTPVPIPYQDWSHPIPNQMTGTVTPLRVSVKCFGKYTFKISNPALFMNVMSGTADIYRKDLVIEQIRTEVIASFQNVLNELGNSVHKVPVLELPSQTDEIKEIMDERVFDEKIRERGISLVGFAVESVTLDEESEKKIDDYELSSNASMQQGRLVGAYADAVKGAANNSNGAAQGFMGIGMMNMATGGMMGGVTQGPWQNQNNQQPQYQQPTQPAQPVQEQPSEPAEEQPAPEAKQEEQVQEQPQQEASKARFCTECGEKADDDAKFCSKCGNKLK